MPTEIDGQLYYRTAEVCRDLGITRNTLFRWLQKGVIDGVEYRDWRGWRLFTAAQVEAIKAKTNHISTRLLEKK